MFDFTIEDFPFDPASPKLIRRAAPITYDFPVVYLIYCDKRKKAYVGETTNVSSRIGQHLANPDKRRLARIRIIFSGYFNKSTVLDIESNLIKYMQGDGQYVLLNGNAGISDHNYYQRSLYYETFKDIWNELQTAHIAKHTLSDIHNSDLFKFSPYKSLSDDQLLAIESYLGLLLSKESSKSTVFIQGSAGTGKTILAVYLIKLLSSEISDDDLSDYSENVHLIDLVIAVKNKIQVANGSKGMKIALVVPMTSLRKTLKKVFKSIHGLSQKMVIGPNEAARGQFDLLIVDEAHRLRRRVNLTNYRAFDNTCRNMGLDIHDRDSDELEWIMRASDNQILFYDENQSVRPSDVRQDRFAFIKNKSSVLQLKSQMRVEGGNDYIDFVDMLLKVDDALKPWISKSYDLKLFTSMPSLIEALNHKEDEHGLCRVISGYSWDWISKNRDVPDVVIDGVELYWNKTNEDWVNSTTEMREMGCIHTTQGYDLNYSGIIFGSDIIYDKELGKIVTIYENYYDKSGKAGTTREQLHNYIINIYKTIMYRGIKGTYIYCYDKNLQEYFSRFIFVES